MDDEVVHLHLEHRVVQRLLGRFTAQGFVHHDLSRACLAQTTDAIPRVLLLGRLCLYGPGAARLHEELIPVTARWTDPPSEGAADALRPEAESRTLDLLERSLLPGNRPSWMPSSRRGSGRGPGRRAAARTPGKPSPGAGRRRPRRPGEAGRPGGQAMGEILEPQKKHISRRRRSSARSDGV